MLQNWRCSILQQIQAEARLVGLLDEQIAIKSVRCGVRLWKAPFSSGRMFGVQPSPEVSSWSAAVGVLVGRGESVAVEQSGFFVSARRLRLPLRV
jgi:hypothetical protein